MVGTVGSVLLGSSKLTVSTPSSLHAAIRSISATPKPNRFTEVVPSPPLYRTTVTCQCNDPLGVVVVVPRGPLMDARLLPATHRVATIHFEHNEIITPIASARLSWTAVSVLLSPWKATAVLQSIAVTVLLLPWLAIARLSWMTIAVPSPPTAVALSPLIPMAVIPLPSPVSAMLSPTANAVLPSPKQETASLPLGRVEGQTCECGFATPIGDPCDM